MANESTQQLVEVADIKENIVLLKNGSLRAVLEVSAINFELRSEEEQRGIIQNFQNFLNSIDFPLQIVMNSRRLDIEDYLKLIDTTAENIQNELLKIQAIEYSKYVKQLLELSNIMSKKFYIVVPFYVYEAPSKTGIMESFKGLVKPSQVVKKITTEQLDTYKTQLLQRVELIYDGLVGLGLKASLLERDQLINMFYQLYNPGTSEKPIENPENQQNG